MYDWDFNMVDEPTEWAFNWQYSAGGTATPVPRPHHATLWQIPEDTTGFANELAAIKRFYKMREEALQIKLEVTPPVADEDQYFEPEPEYGLRVIDRRTNATLMTGIMGLYDDYTADRYHGNHAVFESTTKAGTTLMKRLMNSTPAHGAMAMIEHVCTEQICHDYTVTTVTGKGQHPNPYDSREDLATRFALYHRKEEVARCHMTYRDITRDSSIGPTIQMIEVKQSRRGEGISPVLWFWVRRFIENNFTMECLSFDAPPRHTMVKATDLTPNEIDIRLDPLDGQMSSMNFKEFLYDYYGFSVREQKAAMFACNYQDDEEAVLYIPMQERGAGRVDNVPPEPALGEILLYKVRELMVGEGHMIIDPEREG